MAEILQFPLDGRQFLNTLELLGNFFQCVVSVGLVVDEDDVDIH